jgi:hypothetical protein
MNALESSFTSDLLKKSVIVKTGTDTVMGTVVSADSNGVWLILASNANKPHGIPTNMQPLRMYFPFAQMSWLATSHS